MPPNGSESINLSIGGKSLGISAKDLIPILLLIGLFLGGYLIYMNNSGKQSQAIASLAHLVELGHTNQKEIVTNLSALQMVLLDKITINHQSVIDLVHQNRQQLGEELRAQNTLLHSQTASLEEAVSAQTGELRELFQITNYNLCRDRTDCLPLIRGEKK